jgi:DNA-binding CsgD family transcriptional regulator
MGGSIELTERQREVLERIQATPRKSKKTLAEKLSINLSAVDKHLTP